MDVLPEIQLDFTLDEDQDEADDLFAERTPVVRERDFHLNRGLLGVLDADFTALIGRKASSSTPYISRSLSCASGSSIGTISPASGVFTSPAIALNLAQSVANTSCTRLTKHKYSDAPGSTLFPCDLMAKKPRSSDASNSETSDCCPSECMAPSKLVVHDSLLENGIGVDSGFADGSDFTASCSQISHEQSYCNESFQQYRSRSVESLNSIGSDIACSECSNNTFSETSSITSESSPVDSLLSELHTVESGSDLNDSGVSSTSVVSSNCSCKLSSSLSSSSYHRTSSSACFLPTQSSSTSWTSQQPSALLPPPPSSHIPKTHHQKHSRTTQQGFVTPAPPAKELDVTKVLEPFSPTVADRLIGRKMGLASFDIVGGLLIQNQDCLPGILAYLSGADLCSVSLVSSTWRDVVQRDASAYKCKKDYIRSFTTCERQKENCGKLLESRRGLTSSKKILSIVQKAEPARRPAPIVSELKVTDKPVVPHQRFWQEASKLRNDESLIKCPKCQKPAKKHEVQERGWCTHKSCAYDFCTRCRNPFHGAKSCTSTSTSKTKSDSSVGSKKSKKALRRL